MPTAVLWVQMHAHARTRPPTLVLGHAPNTPATPLGTIALSTVHRKHSSGGDTDCEGDATDGGEVSGVGVWRMPAHTKRAHEYLPTSRACRHAAWAKAWAWVSRPALAPSLSPVRKVPRALFQGRDPSTGWARPRAIERMPSRARRAPSATPKMKTAQPSRARTSHELRKRARDIQLAESITRICAGRAGMRRSKSALTFEICSTSFERARQLGNVLAKVV